MTPEPTDEPKSDQWPTNEASGATTESTSGIERAQEGGADTSHLDTMIEDMANEEAAEAQETAIATMKDSFMGKEAFFMMFCAAFALPNQVAAGLRMARVNTGPLPLASLPIAPHEQEAAQGASDALYDTIVAIPALHFIIQPGGEWMPRIIAIATFGGLKLMAIKAELTARAHAAATASDEAQEGDADDA
ncbi:hypothetical protein [Parvularcula sp. LCG005]|uniref:hypothetical protein n=1 Tax=Parvularcula sp. LCG005 TaxID=3078805 RepID=UPI002942A938|nr:hypothetical protein [Parvularcula sp. LCG005]WOI51966.1 hypothetical protein RUI03_07330 [Parvularcula sp. LCG005]